MQHADHGFALRHQAAHQRDPVGLVRRVQVGQGFVHQHHVGLHRQQPRQQNALPLAARKRAQWAALPVPGLGLAQGALHRRVIGRAGRCQPGLVRQAAQQGHVVHREVVGAGFSGAALRQPGQGAGALARGHARHGLAVQQHLALVRQHARQRTQQGGFARAVGADDAGPAAAGQGQIHPLQHMALVVALAQGGVQVARLQRGCGLRLCGGVCVQHRVTPPACA